jgi:hypothetical protein
MELQVYDAVQDIGPVAEHGPAVEDIEEEKPQALVPYCEATVQVPPEDSASGTKSKLFSSRGLVVSSGDQLTH